MNEYEINEYETRALIDKLVGYTSGYTGCSVLKEWLVQHTTLTVEELEKRHENINERFLKSR